MASGASNRWCPSAFTTVGWLFSAHAGGCTANPSRDEEGFSLIELVIAVAIVGILAAIAYPSYQDHLRKGFRAAAQEHLMEIAQRQQQFFVDNRTYAPDVATLNLATPGDVASRYNITIAQTAGPPPTFTATATAIGVQVADGNLSINSAGTKTPANKW